MYANNSHANTHNTRTAGITISNTDCTPYLLELGLTKSRTSMVWVAGPLSGMIVAPVVGVLADRSTSPYGRRRPFMIGGSIVVAVCMLMLGWAVEITQFFFGAAASVRLSASVG